MTQFLGQDSTETTGKARGLRKSWWMIFLAGLFGMVAVAYASGPIFSIDKNVCLGDPTTMTNPVPCPLAGTTSINTPIYYTFTVTNPWGQPQQNIDLTDTFPSGFVQTGPLTCKDDLGNSVTVLPPSSATNSVGQITLDVGRTVMCYIAGHYTSTGSKPNTVTGTNKDHYNPHSGANTDVVPTTPLNSDLSVTKSGLPTSIDVSSGPQTITYTITIHNGGPADVDLSDYFVLHDNLSLLPGSVPLNATFVSATCLASAGTDCLTTSPTLSGGSPLLVGTMGPHHFFDWSFPTSGTGHNGHLQAGGTITLTVTISVDQLPGLACTISLHGNGLRNTTFFTLTKPGSALSEINPANNTAHTDTAVETGQTTIDPDCGKAHLKITKERSSPADLVPWNVPVEYKITIENHSMPHQSITIAKHDLEDWVTEGVNTPRFTRTHPETICDPSGTTISGICGGFDTIFPGSSSDINNASDHHYNFYGEANKGWDTGAPIVIQWGEKITFRTRFTYAEPDCETVPNANPKPIINTAHVHYMASAVGAASASPQNVAFDQQADAPIYMEKQDACEFVVTKSRYGHWNSIKFGVPQSYKVTFTNNGAARDVGTVMDAGRITLPNYATSLPFTSTWNCVASGVSGAGPLTGSAATMSGNFVNTSNPAQGSPVINIGSNIHFGHLGTITCIITITIKRPAFNDPYCTMDDAYFENLALMDTTNPFNNNIAWPPSGSYPALASNPTPQDKNWATVRSMLPECWDANVNKSATVGGLPSGSSPWTYVGNSNPIVYTITTTNTAHSPLGDSSSPTPGWVVKDGFAAPYTNTNATPHSPPCTPSTWCWTSAPHDPRWQVGIKNLAAGANGVWNIDYPGPFFNGQDVHNKACVEAQGVQAGPTWYQNSNGSTNCDEVTVPVIQLTEIKILKQVVDLTGANIHAMGPFGFDVNCTPYAIPTAYSHINIATNASTFGSGVVTHVPLSSTCTIAETSTPPIPSAMAQACHGAANVELTTVYGQPTNPLSATGNSASAKNTYQCKGKTLTVYKSIDTTGLPPGTILPPAPYVINANCTPPSTPLSITIMAGSPGSGTGTFSVPTGAVCTPTETPPTSMPTAISKFCASQHMTAVWDAPIISPSPVTMNSNQTVSVRNKWHCVPKQAKLDIIKKITNPSIPGVPVFPIQNYVMNVNCTSPSSSTTVTIPTNGSAGSTILEPIGANCTVTEAPPAIPIQMAHYCASQGGVAVWSTAYSPASVTIGSGSNSLIVLNTWHCTQQQKHDLKIVKKITNPSIPGVPTFPVQSYVMNVNCVSPAFSGTVTINTNGSANGSIAVPLGATCTVTEVPPAIPPQMAQFCANQGGTAVWDTPVYTPAGTIIVTNSNYTVQVNNTWHCVTQPRKLTVNKRIDQGPLSSISPMTFTINANCTPAASPTSMAIAAGSTSGSGTFTVPNGATCSVSETPPTTFPTQISSYCANQGGVAVWDTPVITPASVTMTSNQTVNVLNKWHCNPSMGQLTIVKTLVDQNTPLSNLSGIQSQNYVMNVNCTGPASSTTVTLNTNNTATTTTPEPVGATCTVTEVPPAFLLAITQYCAGKGQTPVWTTFTVPSSGTVTITAAGPNTVRVYNGWKCQGTGNGQIEVIKELNTIQGPMLWPASNWVINTNCNPPASNSSVTVNTSASGNAVITGSAMTTAPIGANCTVNEPSSSLPAFPAWINNWCSMPIHGGGVPMWDAPTYTPSANVNVSGGVQTVTVHNSWHCGTAVSNGQVQLFKKVTGPASVPPIVFSQTYTINSNCASTVPSLSAGATTAGGFGAFTAPVGTVCNLTENPAAIDPLMTTYCAGQSNQIPMWDPPSFVNMATNTPITMPLTIGSTMQNVQVVNNWHCVSNAKKKPKFKINIGIGFPFPFGGGHKNGEDPPTQSPGRP